MKSPSITPRYKPPLPAIKLGSSERSRDDTRYGTLLVWFMRVMSVLWLAQGLLQWSSVLMADADGQGVLQTMSTVGIGAVMFFAVIDFVAAVGLWLAAPWGGVVWLVAIGAQWLSILLLPGFFAHDILIGTVALGLVAAYLVLTFRAARENEPYA